MDASTKKSVLDYIDREIESQDQKWGADRILEPSLWYLILGEEVGEVSRAILEHDPENYLDELVDVAAVAISAIGSYLRAKETQNAKTD